MTNSQIIWKTGGGYNEKKPSAARSVEPVTNAYSQRHMAKCTTAVEEKKYVSLVVTIVHRNVRHYGKNMFCLFAEQLSILAPRKSRLRSLHVCK